MDSSIYICAFAADKIVIQVYVEGVRLAEERLGRLDGTIEEFVPSWKLAPIVEALQALRCVDLVVAVTFVVEIGDIRRFESPRQLMGYFDSCRRSDRQANLFDGVRSRRWAMPGCVN